MTAKLWSNRFKPHIPFNILKKDKKMEFNRFLQDFHMEKYNPTDDEAIDLFSDWISELDAEQWIILGNLFALESKKESINNCQKMVTDSFKN